MYFSSTVVQSFRYGLLVFLFFKDKTNHLIAAAYICCCVRCGKQSCMWCSMQMLLIYLLFSARTQHAHTLNYRCSLWIHAFTLFRKTYSTLTEKVISRLLQFSTPPISRPAPIFTETRILAFLGEWQGCNQVNISLLSLRRWKSVQHVTMGMSAWLGERLEDSGWKNGYYIFCKRVASRPLEETRKCRDTLRLGSGDCVAKPGKLNLSFCKIFFETLF